MHTLINMNVNQKQNLLSSLNFNTKAENTEISNRRQTVQLFAKAATTA